MSLVFLFFIDPKLYIVLFLSPNNFPFFPQYVSKFSFSLFLPIGEIYPSLISILRRPTFASNAFNDPLSRMSQVTQYQKTFTYLLPIFVGVIQCL